MASVLSKPKFVLASPLRHANFGFGTLAGRHAISQAVMPLPQPSLSVILPALDAAPHLQTTLASLKEAAPGEILLVDGGSSDGTAALADSLDAKVISSARGRGPQLRAGGAAAQGDWLLFVHADTHLEAGWAEEASAFMAEAENQAKAAVFRFALDHPAPQARRIERLANWRAQRLGLPYGDQGLLISRAFYQALGGFKPLALMEDVEIVRRIGRKRLVFLQSHAITSAERYRLGGWWVRPARNLCLLGGYFLRLPPRLLARLYG